VKVIVVGAGINGVTSAIALKNRGHDVDLVDPGPLPHPLAASTDISKASRGAYGPDEDYTQMLHQSARLWRDWNAQFGVEFYHEVGFLFMRHRPMEPGDFEFETLKVFERRRRAFERINADALRERFPAWNADYFQDGFLEAEAGYVESGLVVSTLVKHAQAIGVCLRENTAFAELNESEGKVSGILLQDGQELNADSVVMAVGAWTPYLLPFTREFFRATGHPIFHLRPSQPDLFTPQYFPVFGADISTTGFYGFPLNRDGVVKIGNHGQGREIFPGSDNRSVTGEEEEALRNFIALAFPSLTKAAITHSHICVYCDTHDGDFWIARDPEREGLVITTGDNGHGFKFAPILGELAADAAEGKENSLLEKFRWRPEIKSGVKKEAARFRQGL
jgi:glycine/D-amino acid oxidase-like deaminating enzyme